MRITVEIDTDQADPWAARDLAILRDLADLLGSAPQPSREPWPVVERPEPEPAATPAAEPEATPEPEPAAPSSGKTLDDAITAATNLVSQGKSDAVRAALATVGCDKVGNLPADKVAAFITELEG